MARATRSTAAQQHEKDKLPDPSSLPRAKQTTKKRKRTSLADNDDQPPLKQRYAENGIKEEQNGEVDEKLSVRRPQELDLAGDVPIDPSDAPKILDILALVDTQGLLDRVFPLPSSDLSGPSTSKSQAGSFSLRTLLRESSQHPLRVLRSAVLNLFPISFNPRSRASSPAAQQLRFCTLAQSLLDQASFRSAPLSLDIDTILSHRPESPADTDTKPAHDSPRQDKASHSHQNRKYALMQRLPSGACWTSLSSDLVSSDGKAIADVPTANAELVAILPCASHTPSGAESTTATKPLFTTLGSFSTKKPPGNRLKLPGPRRVTCGSFLDYGPYTSFAPSFEQEGAEVGRWSLGEVYWGWEERKMRWTEQAALGSNGDDGMDDEPESEAADVAAPNGVCTPQDSEVPADDDEALEGLFSKAQIRLLKEALGSFELEAAVQELLERNARALQRLGELQNRRLMQPGGFTPVEAGSEEWDTAHGILDSLVLLASLRPRPATSTGPAPLVPSAAALHRLHRTLPIAAVPGWYGTLPPARPSALRDDATLYIKSTATALPSNPPAASASAPAPTPAVHPTAASAAAAAAAAVAGGAPGAPAQPYPPYSYGYPTPYRTGYQFKPPQTYYPGAAYAAAAHAAAGQTQAPGAPQYYATATTGAQYAMQPGQQQYAYSWYQYTPQPQAAGGSGAHPTASTSTGTSAGTGAGTGAGAGQGGGVSALPTTYAGFFSAAAQGGQRAVANTVLGGSAGGKAGGVRPAGAGVSSGQPGYGYYGAYQPTATSAPAQS